MDKFYFSKNNYTLISNIIRDKLYKQYNYDINENSKFRREIINIMNSIYEQKDLYNINFSKMDNAQSSLELTKKVLKTSYSYFSQYIEKTQKNPALFEKKNLVDKRPEPSYVNNTNDVTKMYERLQTERNNVSINPNKDISFTENIEGENTNVNKRYEEISSSRSNDYKNIVDEMNSNNDNLQFNEQSHHMPTPKDSSIQEQFSQPNQSSSIQEQFSQPNQSSSIQEDNRANLDIPFFKLLVVLWFLGIVFLIVLRLTHGSERSGSFRRRFPDEPEVLDGHEHLVEVLVRTGPGHVLERVLIHSAYDHRWQPCRLGPWELGASCLVLGEISNRSSNVHYQVVEVLRLPVGCIGDVVHQRP